MTAYDDFADAGEVVLVDGEYTSAPIPNATFTIEVGESTSGFRTAWWVFTPSVTGQYTLDTHAMVAAGPYDPQADEVDTRLSVFTGAVVNDLTEQYFNDDSQLPGGISTYSSKISDAALEAGVTYHIRVEAWDESYNTQEYILHVLLQVPSDVPVSFVDIDAPWSHFNDNVIDATEVVLHDLTKNYQSPVIPTTVLSVQSLDEPDSTDWNRTAWWVFTPTEDATVVIDDALSNAAGQSRISIWKNPIGGATSFASWFFGQILNVNYWWNSGAGAGNLSQLTIPVVAGSTYYIRVATSALLDNSTDYAYVLRVADVYAPAYFGNIEISSLPRINTTWPTIPIGIEPVAQTQIATTWPTILINIISKIPSDPISFKRVVIEPSTTFADLPLVRPAFILSVEVVQGGMETAEIEFEYDLDGTGGANGSFSSGEFHLSTGPNIITTQMPEPGFEGNIATGSHWWRYRIIFPNYTTLWSIWYRLYFQADLISGSDLTYSGAELSWTIAAETPTPHLWFISPAHGVPGDEVTIFGHGLGAVEGNVTISGVAAEVVSWTLLAGTGATSTRKISATDEVADPEHYEVVIIVPDVPPPGGSLVIET